MKRLLAILLALIMVLTLAACGGEPQKEDQNEKPDKQNSQKEDKDDKNTIKTEFFSVSHSDEWINQEDYMIDEDDESFVNLQILDPEDSDYYLIDLEISVELDDPYDFREDLVYYGFNQYEYKENDAYDTVKIGGVELLQYDDGEETLVYFNRIEGAGATVYIEVDAVDIDDERIEEVLDTLKFTIEDVDNEDGPWEWEGEPFTADDHSVNAGGYTITSQFVPFEAPLTTFETFAHNIAVVEDTVYVLSDGILSECDYDGGELVFVDVIALPEDDYEYIHATDDGSIWLSGSLNDILQIKDRTIVNTYEDIDNLAMHPSGAWGVDYFVSSECSIITFDDGSYSEEEIVFEEVDTIMHLCVDANYIYVCASAADDSGHKVFVYDKDGALQYTLCDSEGEGMGSITFVTQTANGFIGFDGNMRDVILWDNSGVCIAEISDSDLFGTDYPWFCASAVCSDGSILTLMTQDREDQSATEVVVFHVKGF